MTDPANLSGIVDDLCSRGRPAGQLLATTTNAQRQAGLQAAADALLADADVIVSANAKDVADGKINHLSKAMLDRLHLDHQRLEKVVADLRRVANQPDPLGRIIEERQLDNGLQLQKIKVPIGVIAIIFESRPNVTVDAAALCIRSGNACVLRGGKEAVRANHALAEAFRRGLAAAGLPEDGVQLVPVQDRELVQMLLKRNDALDLVVPRGGEGLIKSVVAASTIPVVKHDKGVCSLYVHAAADLTMATQLICNAKCQRPGVCNSIENVLVDRTIAETFLPQLTKQLIEGGVEIRIDPAYAALVPDARIAEETDWQTEYLDLILAIKVVENVNEAIAFTNANSSQHSDGIITADQTAADAYLRGVVSACVYHNASTRFTDGAQFGLGAEVGISTNRLHARGPMGADDLCTYKYVVRGSGQTVH
jgi:glutamate-5-semialdehyde dehydrogenase